MYRGQYDTDVTTFSQNGRLFQIEYAQEAVNQGTAVVGLRGSNFAVLASQKRTQSKLAYYQQKLFRIDDHMCSGISGLTSDGRVLVSYMRSECLNHKYVYDTPMTVGRLISQIGSKAQSNTMRYGKRPFGVALLTAGYDSAGPHIHDCCPSGNFFEYHACAIGARSQSARTYLEKNFETFTSDLGDLKSEKQALIRHAVKAMSSSAKDDIELTAENLTVMVVGKDCAAYELSLGDCQAEIDYLKSQELGEGDGDQEMAEQ